MQKYSTNIEDIWQMRNQLTQDVNKLESAKRLLEDIILSLNSGKIRVAEKINHEWVTHEWIKKAILLYFQINNSVVYASGSLKWYDKISPKYWSTSEQELQNNNFRLVPGAFIRTGAFIANNTVIMPSFINIGAYVGEGSLIDTWATVGSCAQIGKNCHISGGTGIGGVLEPIQANPVIIEDNCFIGARSEIVEGVIVEEGAIISMGVFIGASTKIVNRDTGEIIYGKVPAYSVVVPGSLPSASPSKPSLYCAVIIKQVDEATRRKTSINEILRCV